MSAPFPDGRLYAECWHPDSPGVRLIIRPSWARRLGLIQSPFATLRETLRYYRDLEPTDLGDDDDLF